MTTRTKIIIAVLIITAIIVAAAGLARNLRKEEKTEKKDEYSEMVNYYTNDSEPNENKIENNIVEEQNTQTINNTEASKKETEVVGKEEKESVEENAGKTDEEIAVELTKKEWGISPDSYNFETEKVEEKVYKVYVRTPNSTIAKYTVNVQTKTVIEEH